MSTRQLAVATVAGVVSLFASNASADVIYTSFFYPSSTYPNPDPGYKKVGDYIYYAEQGGFNQPVWNGKSAYLNGQVTGPHQVTEIRMAQPDTVTGGTLGIYTQDGGMPGTLLGQVSQSSEFLHQNGVTITSWDLSSLNLILDPSDIYYLVMSKPMSWFKGTTDIQHWTAGGGWTPSPIPNDPGPAYEVWAKPVPAPSTAGLVVAAGLVTLTRRRRAFG